MSAGEARSERPDDEADAKEQARIMSLKIIVVALGVILVVLALIVFSTLVWRAIKGGSPSTDARSIKPALSAAQAMGDLAVDIPLAPGARIISTAIGDGRLAVTVEEGDMVTTLLFDAATLSPAGRISWRRRP